MPDIKRQMRELDARLRLTVLDLQSARREMKRYARRLNALNASLSRRRQQLQHRVNLREGELAEKVKRLSILYEVGHALSGTLELDRLLDLIVRLAARHLKARKASLMLIDERTGRMKINSAVGIRAWIVERTRIAIGEGIAGQVAGSGRAVLIKDIATDRRFRRPSRGTYRTGSFLSVPIKRRERVLGVLNVSDKRSQEPFDADDFRLVTTLAAEASIAVENATLYRDLREKITSLEELYRARDAERRQLFTLINSINDGIVAVDLGGSPLFVNDRARGLLDLPDEEWGRRQIKDLLPPGDLSRSILEGMRAARDNAVIRRETTVGQGGGDRRHFELISLPVHESRGDLIAALTVIRDVTEYKELDQARSDFLNRASHQLKTPVGLIKGFADTLVKHQDMDQGRRRHFLELVHAESGRLADLIENLLDFSQIDSQIRRVERERVVARDLLRKALPVFETRAAEKGVTLRASLSSRLPVIETDPTCLMEAVRNILDNSIKFTPRGGTVRVTARASGGGIELQIADTGSGIDEGELPRIFEKFYVGRAGEASGTGLGLYIAKEMINTLGDGITVRSRSGEGTTVTITLPPTLEGAGA